MAQSPLSIPPQDYNHLVHIPLTDEEQLGAFTLSTLQIYGLQNLRCDIANDIIRGIADVRNESETDYRIKQAYLKGQLDILAKLIDRAIEVSQLSQQQPLE